MLTSFLSALFCQLKFELLVSGQECLIQGTHPLQLIFEVLSPGKSFNADSKELVLRLRVLDDFLDERRSRDQEQAVMRNSKKYVNVH
jgi:hypothetical protein